MNTKQIVATTLFALISTSAVRAQPIEYSNANKSASEVSSPRLLSKNIPLTLTVKDLDSIWQFVTLNETQTKGDDALPKTPSTIPDAIDNALHVAPNVYLTQWQTVSSGNQSFLIVYHIAPMIMSEKVRAFLAGETVPLTGRFAMRSDFLDFLKGWAESRPLELTLLNLQTINAVKDIKPYDIKERDASLMLYIFASRFQETPNKLDFQSLANLKQLATAILSYAQ